MPLYQAIKLCPHGIYVPVNMEKYLAESRKLREIFFKFTPIVEPIGCDEAFLDVTEDKKKIGSATIIAREIKKEIRKKTGLTASAGISFNKFLAKIASDVKKPDGMFVILPQDAERFIEELPIEKFYGIGKVTAEKMHQLGIHSGKDLKKMELADLIRKFGKAGKLYYNICRGIDERPVEVVSERKSIGTELTYEKDLVTKFEIIAELYKIEKELMERMRVAEITGKTITVKIKFSDFKQITRSRTLPDFIRDFDVLHQCVTEIRRSLDLTGTRIRLLGVSVSNLESEEDKKRERQLNLFQ